MQIHHRTILLIILALLFAPVGVFAQSDDETLTLRIRRDFGYGGGSRIQGNFSMRAQGPEGLVEVEFLIDDTTVMLDHEAPFRFDFRTADFEPGVHTLAAVGRLVNGRLLSSNSYTYEFITAAQAKTATLRLIVPILVIVGGLSVVGILIPVLLGGKKGSFKLGEYGAAGGAICPRCTFPYSRLFFSPNLIFGKLGRCPHCGKWAVVRRATTNDLQDAEQRYQTDAEMGVSETAEAKEDVMKRLLDDSRFEG
jgi:hypothetical protein